MAPMKRNRNRDRKNTSVRRRGKNSNKKSNKYTNSLDGSRIKKRITGHKLETLSGRNRNAKSRKMGAGRYSKMAKDGNRGSSSTSKETSDLRTKKYIRKALELGLSSGYLTPDDNSDGQVLRVASEIVKFGHPKEDGSGSDELQDETEAVRGRPAKSVGRPAAGKRLAMKKGRTNLGKRGRSRTKSPKKQIAQKRRRKRSDNRTKVKARIQKRKRASGVKNDEPRTRKSDKIADDNDDADDNDVDDDNDVGDVDPDNDNGNGNDEDDEPGVTNNGDENSNLDNKKSPVSGKPGNVVANTEKKVPTNDEKKSDDEASGNEAASSDDEDEEVEDDDEDEQPEEGLANEEDGNDDNDGQKVED